MTPLVGRAREVAEVVGSLRRPTVRLVTLTGPGGVGKTRLALAVTEAVAGAFGDRVGRVDLPLVADPNLVLPAIGREFEVGEGGDSPLDRLAAFLRGRHLVLVLDNLEQVLAAAPRRLSRPQDPGDQPLPAAGTWEHEFPVAPLSLRRESRVERREEHERRSLDPRPSTLDSITALADHSLL